MWRKSEKELAHEDYEKRSMEINNKIMTNYDFPDGQRICRWYTKQRGHRMRPCTDRHERVN